MPSNSQHIKAVIFDIGGVVLRSPFIAIATYERELGIPQNYLNCSMHVISFDPFETTSNETDSVERGPQGAWQKFERGELPLFEFYEAFSCELSDTINGNKWYTSYCERKGLKVPPLPTSLNVNGRELFGSMMRGSKTYDPHISKAIQRIRGKFSTSKFFFNSLLTPGAESGRFKIIALTNNFARTKVPPEEAKFLGWDDGATPHRLRSLFDDFCDSSALGMRKPEPEFYLLACQRSAIQPGEAVFLDDIGLNLKAAKALGMDTIHVAIGETLAAVKKLEAKLGIDLTSTTPTVTSRL